MTKSVDFERKYILENRYAEIVVNWLNTHCITDPEYPEAIISSVYYDSPQLDYLDEKVNSDYNKTKVRLRWYSSLDGTPLKPTFLEVKNKEGDSREKFRFKTQFSGDELDSIELYDSRLMDVLNTLYENDLGPKHQIFPSYVVRYTRKRYLIPRSLTRICIDYKIHIPKSNNRIIPQYRPFLDEMAVFEMKGSLKNLPNELSFLINRGLKRDSFSKYLNCYQNLTGNI